MRKVGMEQFVFIPLFALRKTTRREVEMFEKYVIDRYSPTLSCPHVYRVSGDYLSILKRRQGRRR